MLAKSKIQEVATVTKASYGCHPDHDWIGLSIECKLGTDPSPYGTIFFNFIRQPDADRIIREFAVSDVAHLKGLHVKIETDESGNRPNSRIIGRWRGA